MKKAIFYTAILSMFVSSTGCSQRNDEEKEAPAAVVEEAPKLSDPPEYDIQKSRAPKRSQDGVWRTDDRRVFGYAAPFGAVFDEDECDELERCTLHIRMPENDIVKFLDKYFPYQVLNKYPAIKSYEVKNILKDEYKEGGVVPSFDPLVIRPREGDEISLKINWSKKTHEFTWTYRTSYSLRKEKAELEAQRAQEQNEKLREMEALKARIANAPAAHLTNEHEIELMREMGFDVMPDGTISDDSLKRLAEKFPHKSNFDDVLQAGGSIKPTQAQIDAAILGQPLPPPTEQPETMPAPSEDNPTGFMELKHIEF